MSNPHQDQVSHPRINAPARGYDSQQPLLPLSPQLTAQESKLTGLILLLACLSTFGASFTDTFLSSNVLTIVQTLQISLQQYSDASEYIQGYTCLAPLLAGIIIYRFGVTKAYRLFVFILALGRIFTTTSLKSPSWQLFVVGESCFQTAILGLTVTQLYMVIKWFKGREISMALGTIAWSDLAARKMAVYFLNHMDQIGFGNILYIGAVLCVVAAACVIFMSKVDSEVKRDDERGNGMPFFEELSLIKPVVWVLIGVVLCFSLGDNSSTSVYISYIINRWRITNSDNFALNSFWYYIPGIMFPLCGYLADKKGKRITMTFIAVMMFFIGNTAFFFFYDSPDSFFVYLAFFLFAVAACLFKVSAWACIGIATPLRVLGLVLGFAYTLINSGYWLEFYFISSRRLTVTAICYAATFALIAGVILVVFTWKLDRKGSRRIEPNNVEGYANGRNIIQVIN